MRSTIHVVSRRDFWPFALAIRRAQRDWLMRVNKEVRADEAAAAAQRLRTFLAGGTGSRKEVSEFGAAVAWLELVRVPPSGTWEKRRADLFAAAEDWLGGPDVTPEDGLVHLVRRYLGGFGPASRHDIAKFTNVPVAQLVPALERMRLRRFRDEGGGELLDLPRAPLPDPDTPAPARFLPTWDATLLVHARRTGVMPEEYRPIVFNTKTPPSLPTFLVDGRVAGSWRYEGDRVRLEPFGRLTRQARRELEDEAERLAAFHAE
jgi:Winged helix DNA-binding domain